MNAIKKNDNNVNNHNKPRSAPERHEKKTQQCEEYTIKP